MKFRALACGALLSIAGPACSDSKPSTGSGDKIVNDAHPQPPSQPPDDAGYADAWNYNTPDGYAPFAACQKCGCSSSTGYCLGGIGGRTSIESCDFPDGGADAGGPPQIGCNVYPPECAKAPSCTCLIDALKPIFNCYPVCSLVKGVYSVYCPNP